MAKPHLRLVPSLELPRIEDASRPFRIWDAKTQNALRYRYYMEEVRAHNSALLLVRWEQVGTVYEVLDVRTGRVFAQYKRGLHGIEIIAIKEGLK